MYVHITHLPIVLGEGRVGRAYRKRERERAVREKEREEGRERQREMG